MIINFFAAFLFLGYFNESCNEFLAEKYLYQSAVASLLLNLENLCSLIKVSTSTLLSCLNLLIQRRWWIRMEHVLFAIKVFWSALEKSRMVSVSLLISLIWEWYVTFWNVSTNVEFYSHFKKEAFFATKAKPSFCVKRIASNPLI